MQAEDHIQLKKIRTLEGSSWLARPFNDEEIWKAPKLSNRDEAPRPRWILLRLLS